MTRPLIVLTSMLRKSVVSVPETPHLLIVARAKAHPQAQRLLGDGSGASLERLRDRGGGMPGFCEGTQLLDVRGGPGL